jgi:hypothetical protein
MTNQLEDVPTHIADELASTMVFAVLNALEVNALALKRRDRWQQFIELADSIADAVDTIRVPAGPRRCIASPANDPNLEDDAMELDSTLCTDEAELVMVINNTPLYFMRFHQFSGQLTLLFRCYDSPKKAPSVLACCEPTLGSTKHEERL